MWLIFFVPRGTFLYICAIINTFMKIVPKTAEGLKIVVGENEFTIVDIPILERPFLRKKEERMAKDYVKTLLASEKESLESEEWSVEDFCRTWWQTECDTLQSKIDLGVDSLSSAQLKQFESRLRTNLAYFEEPNTQWATLYAQRNSGKKPPHSVYEKEFNELTDMYTLLGFYSNFVRDNDLSYIFPTSASCYTAEKIAIIDLLQCDTDFFEAVQSVMQKGVGFTRQKMNETAEKITTEINSQSLNTVGME